MERTGRVPIYQVDAFTDRPFAGNPAAICFPRQAMPDNWMQASRMLGGTVGVRMEGDRVKLLGQAVTVL